MAGLPAVRGTLYIVATPIGNLDDISARAIETLRSVALVAAEDTRHTLKLLRHLAINTQTVSLHEHNEVQRAPALVDRLLGGDSVALVSDAGTPLVSDPGHRLVNLAREAGVIVSPVPGPCALTAALSACGVGAARFAFEGFLPAASAARRAALGSLATEARTMVFYESPHRIVSCVADMALVFGGDRRAALCRELTKRYESIHVDTLERLGEWLRSDDDRRRGEFVVVLAGAEQAPGADCRPEWVEAVRELGEVLPPKRAARIIAKVTGASSQVLYRLARDSQR